ncbi:MAG: helix-turn-helix domain-containing protein, partial [Nitrososphaera sp.]
MGVIPNNCVSFVEEVIKAGGGTWSSYSNCPDLATQDTVSERIQRFLGQMEGKDIYLIAPNAKVQAALLLRTARASRSQGEVAEAMGTTWQAYQKIEQPDANT